MLYNAIVAQLPLIAAYTTDTINVDKVLDRIAGQRVYEGIAANPVSNSVYFCIGAPQKKYRDLYKLYLSNGATLIVVNPEAPDALLFDAGVIHVPGVLRKELLDSVYEGDEMDSIDSSLQGLTYKEMLEVLHMTVVMGGQLSAEAVRKTRRAIIKPVVGVRPVHEEGVPYIPNQELLVWASAEGLLFHQDNHLMLRPKGLLFKGSAGTGKTEGAKWLARKLKVPLYLLDVSSLASKYFSESEQNLSAALRQIEQLAPCVMLIDEAEKIFIQNEDSGTTGRLLSGLLWWLQERTANVLTVMTTNHEEKLPPELYRTGRIDRVIDFPLLSPEEAYPFSRKLLQQYGEIFGVNPVGWSLTFGQNYSHAEVVDAILQMFRTHIVDTLKP